MTLVQWSLVTLQHQGIDVFKRRAEAELERLAAQGKVLLVTGAHGSGKTSSVRAALPDFRHVDAKDPGFRRDFIADALGSLLRIDHPTIIDNAETLPELFKALRWYADHHPAAIPLVILSSISPVGLVGSSMDEVTGLSIVEIGGLSMDEICSTKPSEGWRQLWLRGGSPPAFLGNAHDWHVENMHRVAEEISCAIPVACEPDRILDLLRVLSTHHGQALFVKKTMVASGLGRAAVLQVLSALVDRFVIRLLHGVSADGDAHGGRMPRFYFRDSGMLHALWDVRTEADLDAHPMRQESWEGFVLEESLSQRGVLPTDETPYFVFRDKNRRVVPIAVSIGSQRRALFPYSGVADAQAFRNYEKRSRAFGCDSFQVVDYTIATWGIPRATSNSPTTKRLAIAA